ncbi:conserved hypothetical protein [uncultured Gammaproteobacteria bacterium]
MVSHLQIQRLADILEGVTEHAVTDIVDKCCGQGHLKLVLFDLTAMELDVLSDQRHQPPRSVEYPDAVSETSVGCAGVNQFGKAELSDPAQALERPRSNDLPQDLFELIGGIEFDQVMQRVTDTLAFQHRCS